MRRIRSRWATFYAPPLTARSIHLARQGKLVLPAPEYEVEFAAMVIAAPLPNAEPSVDDPVEITVGTVTIRLAATTSATRIAAIVPLPAMRWTAETSSWS